MAEKQLSLGDDEIVQILNKVYQHFRDGQFADAVPLLERALAIDFEYPGVAAALKCAGFWRERQTRGNGAGPGRQPGGRRAPDGEDLVFEQWRQFGRFLSKTPDVSERCVFSIRTHVFGTALQTYVAQYESSTRTDAGVLHNIGRCYKHIGNYEAAIEYLELANRQKRDSAPLVAELADCYSLVNETRAAKAFFREAFFLGATEIDLTGIESPMVQRLVARLREQGIPEAEISEWIPVYGALYGVLNVKRELRPLEFGRLKQSIHALEKQIEARPRDAALLAPRLLNRYFWLVDHLRTASEDKSRIDEVLAKIRLVNPSVYEEYVR
jgi:tetratricopeptide (TPR) repeat protein